MAAARWALLALLATGCAPALGDLRPSLSGADRGTIWFRTDEPLALSGDLGFPAGPGPFPAVVLMHGCGGIIHRHMSAWTAALQARGYATFVVDSFRGRGLTEVCTSAALAPTRRIPDAYGALRILATHPRIARDRIAIIGFSHGGLAALSSGTAWAAQRYVRAGETGFRAFVAFYPSCNGRSAQWSGVAGPIRIHTGELDDWTPAATCVELATEATAAGADIAITVYPGAAHGFDSVGTPHVYRPDVLNGSMCRPRVTEPMGAVINAEELKDCVRRGATIGWNPDAEQAARRNVAAELAELLAPRR
jgi:dienelactone hydrolase